MSRPTTPILGSRPRTSRLARRHTSPPDESDLKHASPSCCYEENTWASCAQPPCPPVSRQPSLQQPRSPTPEITLSDWQPVEPSPALWVFLKNVAPPPSAPELEAPSRAQQQTGGQQARLVPLPTDGHGSRCDSVVDEEMLPCAERDGGEMGETTRRVDVDVESKAERTRGIRRVWGRVRGWMLGCLI